MTKTEKYFLDLVEFLENYEVNLKTTLIEEDFYNINKDYEKLKELNSEMFKYAMHEEFDLLTTMYAESIAFLKHLIKLFEVIIENIKIFLKKEDLIKKEDYNDIEKILEIIKTKFTQEDFNQSFKKSL